MKYVQLLFILPLLQACDTPTRPAHKENGRQVNIPDTTDEMHANSPDRFYYNWKDKTTRMLELPPLEKGIRSFELRFWVISAMSDPQDLYILGRTDSSYRIDRYTYYISAGKSNSTNIDSAKAGRTRLSKSAFDSLLSPADLQAFWQQPSQSQMKNGNSYGCNDGYTVLIEMADTTRYKFAKYTCPDLHTKDDAAFKRVDNLHRHLLKFLERIPVKPLDL